MGGPPTEQRGSPEAIGPDGYGPQYAPAPAKPHEISDETGPDRSRRRVEHTLPEPFKLPEAVDPLVRGTGIAPHAGLRSHRKSFEPLGAGAASNSDKNLVSHTVPPLAPSRANKVGTAPAAAALNVRKSALTVRSTAPSRSTATPRSPTAPALGSNPVAAATARSVKAVTPPTPIHPAPAPVAADFSEVRTNNSTRSSTPPQPIEKPNNAWITNEAAPKSNINR